MCKPIYPSTNIFDDTYTVIHDQVIGEIEKLINLLETEKQRVSAVYQEQLELVNNTWLNNKLSMVPGDLLIDMVCQEYNVRFKKERDGSRLAAFIKQDEIDQELKDIVSEIGSCS